MKYKFPEITNISDVLPHVEGRDDFSVTDRGDFTYICYNVMRTDTFPPIESEVDAILRECRGITFCSHTGNIIARKFHKFFNLGEREETLPDNIDWSQHHDILDKVDGSMIVPVKTHDGYIRWHSKRGLSDTAMRAEVFVAKNSQYQDFAMHAILNDWTPIFEWASRKDKIVLDYEKDDLILLAIRDMTSGNYFTRDEMLNMRKPYNIPVVEQHDPDKMTTEQLIKTIGGLEDAEGIVIRFKDGHMLKVKSTWYCNLHKVISNFTWEYNIVRVILEDQMDDLKSVLVQHKHPLANEISAYENEFWTYFNRIILKASKQYMLLVVKYGAEDRKGIATDEYMTTKASPLMKMLIFKTLDGKQPVDVLKTHLIKNVNRNTPWQRIKETSAFGYLKWNGRGGS